MLKQQVLQFFIVNCVAQFENSEFVCMEDIAYCAYINFSSLDLD